MRLALFGSSEEVAGTFGKLKSIYRWLVTNPTDMGCSRAKCSSPASELSPWVWLAGSGFRSGVLAPETHPLP